MPDTYDVKSHQTKLTPTREYLQCKIIPNSSLSKNRIRSPATLTDADLDV